MEKDIKGCPGDQGIASVPTTTRPSVKDGRTRGDGRVPDREKEGERRKLAPAKRSVKGALVKGRGGEPRVAFHI